MTGAIDVVLSDYWSGAIEHEPEFTDRMLGGIRQSLNGYRARGIVWRAKTLTSRTGAAQEREFGADFAGVLNVNTPDFTVAKGFLAQAKRGNLSSSKERDRLVEQCETMLKHSPASFVFVYNWNGVRVLPAISVVAAKGRISHCYDRPVGRFFEEHLECFIGDPAINAATPETLNKLREKVSPRAALLLTATRDEERRDRVFQEDG